MTYMMLIGISSGYVHPTVMPNNMKKNVDIADEFSITDKNIKLDINIIYRDCEITLQIQILLYS